MKSLHGNGNTNLLETQEEKAPSNGARGKENDDNCKYGVHP